MGYGQPEVSGILIYYISILTQQANRSQNKEELFNLRHAQLRNVLEHIFSVLKREFKMAVEACEYPIKIQCLTGIVFS